MRKLQTWAAVLLALVGAVLGLTIDGNTLPVGLLVLAFILLALHLLIVGVTQGGKTAPEPAEPGKLGFSIDKRGQLGGIRGNVLSATGWTPAAFRSLTVADYVAPHDLPELQSLLDDLRWERRNAATTVVQCRVHGRWLPTRLQIGPVDGSAPHRLLVVQTAVDPQRAEVPTDVTASERHNSLARLSAMALEGADLTSLMNELIRLTIEEFSAGSAELYRLEEGLLLAQTATGRSSATEALRVDQTTLAGATVHGKAGLVLPADGSVGFVAHQDAHLHAAREASVLIRGPHNPYGVLVARVPDRTFNEDDLTFLQLAADTFALALQRQGATADAKRRASYDMLTGLPNQSVFFDRVSNMLERSNNAPKLSAVYILDLDNFAVVNDSVGHATGDLLLELLANRLQEAVRPGDLLARFGGDEFTLLAEGLDDEAHALVLADRLRGSLSDPFPVGGHEVRVTATVGVALTDIPDLDAGTLLQQADAAMMAGKQAGKNTSCLFDQVMVDTAVTRLRTESELREALDNDQLRVFYQPVVDLQTGQTVSAEALVRWFHPGRGLVMPDEFIPISEATTLVEDISNWVLLEAAKQAAQWANEGKPLPVSVNLAARQITNRDLPKQVAKVLERTGLDPSLLSLEITEHNLVDDLNVAADVIRELQKMSVNVAVDDFGTGYSSLAYLRKLPIDIIKIDRDFIFGLTSSGDDFTITSAVIRLASALGKTVVAEGVETEAQLTVLRELGCDQAQGYLFSPAVIPSNETESAPEWSELVLGRAH